MVQFSGETRREAIVNHYSLDIEEEESFISYIEEMGYHIEDEDELIENLYKMWLRRDDKVYFSSQN